MSQNVAKAILGEPLNEDKLKDTFGLTQQKHTDMNVPKVAIACLRFLLTNAVKFGATSEIFSEELQQLGLPKEHASALCRVLDEFGGQIKEILASKILRINEFEGATLNVPENTIDCVQLELRIKNEIIDGKQQRSVHNINISKGDAKILLKELRTVKQFMDEMDYDKKYNNDSK